MPFNGSGVFQRVRNWVADTTAGIKIRADYHDSEDDGFAAGLTNCITRDGQSIVTQNIPFNAKRITGLADPVNPQDATTKNYADTKFGGGGTMTGDLTIKKDGPQLVLDDTDALGSSLVGQHMDKTRWVLRLGNSTPESTGNVGSDFDVLHYADDGTTLLGQALLFSRATGLGTVQGNPTNALGIATKQYADAADAALQASINTKQADLGFTPVQQGGGTGMNANKLYLGWDGSGIRFQVDNNDTMGYLPRSHSPTIDNAVINGRLAYAGDIAVATGPQNTTYEPYNGAVITGWIWVIFGGYPLVSNFRMRYVQLFSTSWYTIGYA
jgi:hypothetical protein